MRSWLVGLVLCAGCTAGSGDPDDADTDAAVGCKKLPEGVWDMDGTCFGMVMSASLTLDETGCSFMFSDWSMAMSVPKGGNVVNRTVTFTGADWKTCSGTFDAGVVTGGCGDGCAYEMRPE